MQADVGQDRDIVRQQLERFRVVLALLFPPFEAVSGHVLWVLYGWLDPWFTPGPLATAQHHAGAAGAQGATMDMAGSLTHASNDAEVGVRPTQEGAGCGGDPEAAGAVHASGAPAVHGPEGATLARATSAGGSVPPEGAGSERWRLFAAVLHDMIGASSKGQAQMLREAQEEHQSEMDMLREALHAHKVRDRATNSLATRTT